MRRFLKIFFKRFIHGIPFGVFVAQIFFTISVCVLKKTISWDELLFRNIIGALIGGYYYGCSAIYSIERLNESQQIVIHFTSCIPFIPLAWFMGWMPRTLIGGGSYLGFYIIWILGFWLYYRRKYKKYVIEMNTNLEKFKKEKN